MSDTEFREFYLQTARPLKAYLSRMTGNVTLADDLLQETYYRVLRAKPLELEQAQRKSYLYRTATNLARDHFRALKFQGPPLNEAVAADSQQERTEIATDIQAALNEIRPAERSLMWLAYVEGASHREIAAATGFKEVSIRPMLFRVRQKLAAILRERGFGKEKEA